MDTQTRRSTHPSLLKEDPVDIVAQQPNINRGMCPAGGGDRPVTIVTLDDPAPPIAATVSTGGSEFWKRAFDLTTSIVLLVLLLPLLAVVSLLVKITSPGPVFFRQVRTGKNGSTFVIWKFRTMRADAERILEQDERLKAEFSRQWKLESDPRITPLGRILRKTSIDELPQLFNVLRGEMSMVGPRPVQPAELEEHYGRYANIVFSVKPGVTGLWQVAGRSSVSYEERVALDLEYIKRRNGWYDLLLVILTIPAVLMMKGAS